MNKKGQTNGLVSGIIFGVAGLIVAVIIAFVITSTLNNAGLVDNDQVYSTGVINESVTFVATNTVKTLSAASLATGSSSISCGSLTYIANQTVTGARLLSGNITQTGCNVINATALTAAGWGGNGTVYVSYPYTTTVSYTKNAAGNISTNFSSGVNNISAKVPTVLLVASIVLILAILAVLVGVWQKMRMGGGSI